MSESHTLLHEPRGLVPSMSLEFPAVPLRSLSFALTNFPIQNNNRQTSSFLGRESASVPPLIKNSAAAAAGAIRSEYERGPSLRFGCRDNLTEFHLSANHLHRLYLGVVPGGGVEPPRAEARRILRPMDRRQKTS